MKRFLLYTLFLVCFSLVSNAQVVQWASKVIEFSSELTPIQYSAQQALGKPNVLPAGGQSPNAWAPDKPKRKEWLKLGFANPIAIRQIAVAESEQPLTMHLCHQLAVHAARQRNCPAAGRRRVQLGDGAAHSGPERNRGQSPGAV